jgi:hypothetical protein
MIRRIPHTTDDAIQLILHAKFRVFNSEDWLAFSGVESEFPMIADDEELIIADGNSFQFYDEDGDLVATYELKKRVE